MYVSKNRKLLTPAVCPFHCCYPRLQGRTGRVQAEGCSSQRPSARQNLDESVSLFLKKLRWLPHPQRDCDSNLMILIRDNKDVSFFSLRRHVQLIFKVGNTQQFPKVNHHWNLWDTHPGTNAMIYTSIAEMDLAPLLSNLISL